MFLATAFLVLAAVVFTLVLVRSGRSLMDAEEDKEHRLHDPTVATVGYVVPGGVDPAVVSAALASAGFESAVEINGPREHLIVACAADGRERVRRAITEAEAQHYAGSGLRIDPVRFDDEWAA